jgi:glycosyltransferase involved in cell wall biosynthesis
MIDPSPQPLISVVLPTYNGSRYIATSIASVLRQTHSNLELIVVDGGSRDNTLDIVNSFNDPRIKIVHQPQNSDRLPGALNLGFANANGDYFTWTQDDDYFADNALEVMLAALQADPNAGMAYAAYWWIDEQGAVTRESDSGLPEALYERNPVGHCFLYRRSVARQVGDYDPAYWMAEDFQYWVRIYKQSKLIVVPGHYAYHRWQSESLTVRGYGRYYALRVVARARREVLGIGWWRYQQQVAASYIEEAFAAYAQHDRRRVQTCLFNGLIRNPGWLRNKGVWSIGLESLLGEKLANIFRRRNPAKAGL